jgi:polysaccharide export outer membrane protein
MKTSTFIVLMALAQAAPQRPPVPVPGTSTSTSTSTAQPQGLPDYLVGPEDQLGVTVQGVAEFTRDVVVESDGTFDFPFIGRVAAGGKGVRAIETEIRSKIVDKRLLLNPVVNVVIKQYRSQTVYVFGAVNKTGPYKIAGNATIMTVLAEAGFSLKSGQTITITRWPKGTKPTGPAANAPNAEVIKVNRRDLEFGLSGQIIALQDGDTINVPETEKYTMTGYVRSPGVFELDGEVTLLQALAIAGGVTEQGAQNRITIQRAGVAKPIKPKLTDLIKPGDIIVIPRKRI